MRKISLVLGLLVVVSVLAVTAEEVPELMEPPFGQPAIITSIGQAGGALQARVLANRAGIEHIYDQRVQPDVLVEGGTLIIVLGASGKGLGAAGVDVEDEMSWAQALVDKARELGMAIIAMHLEGDPRRGDMSDRIIEHFTPQADYIVINEAGNEDGLFTRIAEEYEIPMKSTDTTLGLVPIIAELFGVEE